MRTYLVLFGIAALMISSASAAVAAPINYQVVVNTSSISGTTGSLDFNFNPGSVPPSQAASLQVLNFSSNGSLVGPASVIGDVSGVLPATLTFDNGTGFNDYFEDFTYGSTLSFLVSLSGPALSAPSGTAQSGSTFAFSMFSDTAGTIPALTGDVVEGFATRIDVNLDGTTTPTDYSSQTTLTAVPEPATILLMGSGIIGLWRRRRLP